MAFLDVLAYYFGGKVSTRVRTQCDARFQLVGCVPSPHGYNLTMLLLQFSSLATALPGVLICPSSIESKNWVFEESRDPKEQAAISYTYISKEKK